MASPQQESSGLLQTDRPLQGSGCSASGQQARTDAHSVALPRPGPSVVPGESWAELPRNIRRLFLQDALLTDPSPALATAAASALGAGASGGAQQGAAQSATGLADFLSKQSGGTANSSHGGHARTSMARRERRHSLIDNPLVVRSTGPRQAIGGDLPTSSTTSPCARGLCGPLVVAYNRWRDVMDHLLVAAEPGVAAFRVDMLRRKTANGLAVPAPETLGELFPELGELMRDGSGGLLSLPVVQRIYAALTAALAGLCSAILVLPAPKTDREVSDEASELLVACHAYCDLRAQAYAKSLEEMSRAEAAGDSEATERACNRAIAHNPTLAGPFLVRAGARLGAGDRWRCLEDLNIYLWWSTREGFAAKRHVTAYWRMSEAYLKELEHRAEKQGALLDDSVFHCLIDQAEFSLQLACRHDGDGGLAQSSATKHLMQRIEGHRAARRTAAELLDSPLIVDASETAFDAQDGAEPAPRDYAVPWPIDLSAGLPDTALFSRMPTVGSSLQHEPLDLLLLDFRGVLDLLASLQTLAKRATAFAQKNAECLHWKYRPKPAHVRVQAASAERLAHALLCIMIAKQVGTVSCSDGGNSLSGPAFTMEETPHDRFLCSLLTSVIFCRTLTPAQRAEVDRLLSLLVFASMEEDHMQRAFPWLELDDGRKATLSADVGSEHASSEQQGGRRRTSLGQAISQQQGVTLGGESSWGTSLLLCRLQSIWIGWLSTSGGEAAAMSAAGPSGRRRHSSGDLARLDKDLVHHTARSLLLGPQVAGLCPSLDLPTVSADGGQGSGMTQRRLWALLGYLPSGEAPPPVSDGREHVDRFTDDDPLSRMKRPDPRLRWRPLLAELAALQPQDWCLNPCMLDPVSWQYDARALADPFSAFSWRFRAQSQMGDTAVSREKWWEAMASFRTAADPPFPSPGSNQPPAVEAVWEILMGQIKVLSSVFNAYEAADSAKARAMVRSLTADSHEQPEKPSQHEKQETQAKQTTRATTEMRHVHIKVTSQLRQRVAEEDAEANRDLGFNGDIERELEALKQRRHEVSLDLELRDYVTLTAVREKEKDWWGKGGESAVAYREAISDGATATWNPAPVACAPIRLRLSMFAGSPFQAAKAASYRGLAFDVIDARTLLCSGLGLLGLCTWFDSLLKPTPHAYIQTRHCEELFLEHKRDAKPRTSLLTNPSAPLSGRGREGDATPTKLPLASIEPHAWPLKPAPPRSGECLAAPGTKWPPPSELENPQATPRRPVLTQGGVMRWSAAPRPVHPPPSRLQTPRQRPASVMQLPSPRAPMVNERFVRQDPVDGVGEPRLAFQKPICPRCGNIYLPDANFCRKCGMKRAADPVAVALLDRLQPAVATAPRLPAISGAMGNLPHSADSQRWRHPSYSSQSALFQGLVQESISSTINASQMEYLLGVAVHAEPLNAELALDYLSAAGLPVRHDFLYWDSSLEVCDLMSQNWPGNVQLFTGRVLGGTQEVPQRLRGTDVAQLNPDPLTVFGKYWQQPSDHEKAEALGPRLLRVRRLGGHPSLDLSSSVRRCSNVAFCGRAIMPSDVPDATGGNDPVPCKCLKCGCAWYCSASCQAIHRAAHEFQCQALQSMREAALEFETNKLEKNKKLLATVLENILAKQFSMVASTEALFGCSALTEDLRKSIPGAPPVPIISPSITRTAPRPEISDDEGNQRAGVTGKPRPKCCANQSNRATTLVSQGGQDRRETVTHLMDWAQMMVIPEDRAWWTVGLEAASLESRKVKRKLGAQLASGAEKMPALFDIRLSHAHTAAGVVRMMSRWIGATHRAPALRDVIDEGLIFCVITGLCQTRLFSSRTLSEHAIVSVLAHRMALHIAASHEWRALAPSLAPPAQFQEQGLQGIECAQYSAYFAFLQPRRLPFAKLRPLLPVACVVWGEDARNALMSLPHTLARCEQSDVVTQGSASHEKKPFRQSSAVSSGSTKPGGELVSFLEVATEHIANIQLIDNVNLDAATGKTIFLLYTSVVEGRGQADEDVGEPWVLLLDAARGMQAVACPILARELHRCAL